MLLNLKVPLFILSCRVLKQQSTYNRYFYLTTLILVNSANAAISFQAVYFYLTTLILVNSANAAISFQAVGRTDTYHI